MKKQIFTLGISMAAAFGASAQLATQTFNSGIPATWLMIKGDNNTPSANWVTRIQTELAVKAWMTWPSPTGTAGDSCVLTTSLFTPAGTANRWLISPPFMVNGANIVASWMDYATETGNPDNLQVRVATNGGTTAADFGTVIYDRPATEEALGKNAISLAAYNGQTIRLAFRDNSTDKGILMLDNIGTEVVTTAMDAAVTSLTFPTLVAASAQPAVTVTNNGYTTITSLTITYSIDGGAAVSQTFTGLTLTPFAVQTLTFTTPVTGIATGAHTIQVDLTQANGAADPVASNNTKTAAFAVPGTAVQRAGLMEEFTSSTCAPCAAFNSSFDPLIIGATVNANMPSSNFNIIKYQMNWPSPGNDKSYNGDGLTRRTYYGVNSIPDHFTNGVAGTSGDQAEIDNSKTAPAYMSITGSYIIKSDSIFASATITPNFTITGANFKVRMAATEIHYTNNAATTSQKEYYHVMRQMFPTAAGTTVANWTNGTPQTFTYKAKYTIGGVAQMNKNFWGSPFGGNLIVFVQDDNTKEIFQSKSVSAQWPAGVSNVNAVKDINVFPNPATNAARVTFSIEKSSNVDVQVMDALGRTALVAANEQMTSGQHQVSINTSSLANGTYNVIIRVDGGVSTQRLSVVK